MPKLLQINSVVNLGSTGRIAEQIGSFVIDKGWEGFIAYGRSAGTSSSKLIKIGNNWDQKLHGLQTRLFDRHGLASAGATNLLVKVILKTNPDIIHLHNIHGYYLNYKILFDFLEKQSIPIVWTLHDCWAFTGHCTYFSDINCLKWQTHCSKCPKKKNYPGSHFLDNSFNNFKYKSEYFNKLSNLTLVTVSHWLASMVKQSFLSKHPLQVIHNGVSIHDFYPIDDTLELDSKYGFNNRKVLLAVATSWSKNKGWEDYIKLAELLPADYVIVLVGVTKKQKSLLPPGIIGIERTENLQELARLYSHAQVLLNLSYQETFGMTTIEAAACGTPAIVYNATASPELITAETGTIVEPGDIHGVLKAFEAIVSKGKLFYTQACRQFVLNKFNKEDRFKDYFELYCSLLKTSIRI
jgi:glycosyltransferase involved in cell wall biosynthesis